MVYDKIYDRLVYVHADGTLSPRAAKSWESADGGYAIVFHLDERSAFHDGTPVTAEHWGIPADHEWQQMAAVLSGF